jgi:hypothetical protein
MFHKMVFILLLFGGFVAAEIKIYASDGGAPSEIKPTLMGGATASQDSFFTDVLQMWPKAKECGNVGPVLESEGSAYSAVPTSGGRGLIPRVSYVLSDEAGKIVRAKTVTPKNVPKDICKAVVP